MEEQLLRQIAAASLVPLFSGAEILPTAAPSGPREQSVAFDDPCTIGFKIHKNDPYRLQLWRSQPFAKKDSGGVT